MPNDLPPTPRPGQDPDSLQGDFLRHFTRTLARDNFEQSAQDVFTAFALTVRDRLAADWNATRKAHAESDSRRVCYLSMEFLLGRLLRDAMLNLDCTESADQALGAFGLNLEQVEQREHEAGLGNGGLGRLAACFLDSAASLGLPVNGYGLRYQYGMFRQHVVDGHQVEEPDVWLRDPYPWEIERADLSQVVHFGGRVEVSHGPHGEIRRTWVDTHDVMAVPYDIPVPGYKNGVVNTLRLWSAQATDQFDLAEFNAGSYDEAVRAKNAAENVTMVLYPNDASENGKELRLKQQYFLVSASLKDILADWTRRHGESFDGFAAKHAVQLNDTHPSLAVPELMRLLMDEHGLGWDDAWAATSSTLAYTNHTLLPEALERWPVALVEELLPRLLEIIYEINARFLGEVAKRWPGDNARLERMSVIEESPTRQVRMAHLAVAASFSVNGVAQLHTDLLRGGLFADFNEMWPERFNNKTNGVTPRRWLLGCNPALSELLCATIGTAWQRDLGALSALAGHAGDETFRGQWQAVKTANKRALAQLVESETGIELDPTTMLFDVQVKRIHEYKRQLLNVLHAVHLYCRIKAGETDGMVPRAIIFAGKAAPGYVRAKEVVKLINNVARVVNDDPDTRGLLRVAFLPDYRVSAMEIIAPGADLSAQISTAGNEASGTGNMKLMMNGAVTIGTLDGANVEILSAVGEANFFAFGLSAEAVRKTLDLGYEPSEYIARSPNLGRVLALLQSGHFNQFEPAMHDAVIESISVSGDPWLTAADFASFVEAHERASAAYANAERWIRMSIANTAASGRFSSDRTIADYNRDIWRVEPLRAA